MPQSNYYALLGHDGPPGWVSALGYSHPSAIDKALLQCSAWQATDRNGCPLSLMGALQNAENEFMLPPVGAQAGHSQDVGRESSDCTFSCNSL